MVVGRLQSAQIGSNRLLCRYFVGRTGIRDALLPGGQTGVDDMDSIIAAIVCATSWDWTASPQGSRLGLPWNCLKKES